MLSILCCLCFFIISFPQNFLYLFEGDGGDIQLALAEWTGLRTVPNVFIGGKHIGGCDSKATLPLHLFYSVPICLSSMTMRGKDEINVVIFLSSFLVFLITFYHLGLAAVLEKHRAGQLVPLLNDAGAIATK